MTDGELPSNPEAKYQATFLLRQKAVALLANYFPLAAMVLALAIFVVGLLAVIYPHYLHVARDNEAARKNLQAESSQSQAQLNSILNLKKAYQSIDQAAKEKISGLVPPGGDLSALIPLMESLVLRNGAVMNSVKIESEAAKTSTSVRTSGAAAGAGLFNRPPQGVGTVKIQIDLASVSYPVLKNIIKTLENNLRLMDVAKIDYGVEENKAVFDVYTYYLTN